VNEPIWFDPRISDNSHGLRSPADQWFTRPERRPVVMVDTMRHPRPLGSLTAEERELFDAQLATYEAAVALVQEHNAFAELSLIVGARIDESVHFMAVRDQEAQFVARRAKWRNLRAR
jgi:hypothetical protein